MKKPIENCYWVVPGKMLAGEYPRDKDEQSSRNKIKALIDGGINVFIDLTEEDEGLHPYDMMIGKAVHRHFPIRDISVPDSPGTTKAALDAIDQHLESGDRVYVHCWGGVGRTGVIVGCWLARHGCDGKEALVRLRALWRQCSKSEYRISPETWEQEQYVLKWEAGQ